MDLVLEKRDMAVAPKVLRQKGLIPAELYGHGVENVHVMVSAKEFGKVLKSAGESTLINAVLKIDGKDDRRPVFIHDIQKHPMSDDVTTIDFYQVKMNEKITVSVPIRFIGEAPAVKSVGGVLVKAMQELEVEALPADMPHEIDVNLETLDAVGKSISVKDIVLSKKMKLSASPEAVIATVILKVEEVEAPVAEVNLDAIKVEGEEKRAEKAKTAAEKTAGENAA